MIKRIDELICDFTLRISLTLLQTHRSDSEIQDAAMADAMEIGTLMSKPRLTGENAPPGIHLVFRVSLQQYEIPKYTLIQDRTDIVDRSAQKHRNDRKKKRPENMRIRFRSRSAFSAHLPFKHRTVYKKQEYQKQ